jgi:DNA-directed RNA polymerase specialized sigma24 family protein
MELVDIEQELMLQAYRRLGSYDPARASLPTFIDRVVGNFTANLVEAAGAFRRGRLASTVSLDQSGLADTDLDESLGDTVSSAESLWPEPDLNWLEQIHLRRDLERALRSMPSHLVQCCRWLIDGSITEAARSSGLARGSIYSRIATLKHRCRQVGLEIYLRRQPDSFGGAPVSNQ